MCGKEPVRKPSSRGAATTPAALILMAAIASASPARADGLWDQVLEKFNVKAAPSGPMPAFVERTRPDPAGLGYIPPALPHKVSPVAVKSEAQIQAGKDALDAAQQRQLNPAPPAPVQLAKGQLPKGKKPDKVKPASSAAD